MRGRDHRERDLMHVIERVYHSKESAWYREWWEGNIPHLFHQIPLLTVKHLARTPLPQRQYKKEKSLTKIVYRPHGAFLVQRGIADIACDDIPLLGTRPQVLMTNWRQAIEMSVWVYEHETLPLLSDTDDMAVVVGDARTYRVNAWYVDMNMARRITAGALRGFETKNIALCVLDEAFDVATLCRLQKICASVHARLVLPEAGVVAQWAPHHDICTWVPTDTSILEVVKGRLVVSKTTHEITPLIRYHTNIRARLLSVHTEQFTLL